MSPKLKAHLSILTANIMFGINYSLSKGLLAPIEWLTPSGLCVARIGSAAIFFSILVWGFMRERVDKKDWGWLALASLLGIGGNQFIFLQGMKLTSPVDASIIATVGPVLVLLISTALGRDKITPLKLVGIIIGALGALTVILYGSMSAFGMEHLSGNLLVFLSAISYACYLIVVKDLMKKYRPMTVMASIFGVSGLIMIPTLGGELVNDTQWSEMPISAWVALIFVVVGATCIAYFCVAKSLKTISPTTASIYSYSQPVIASFFAISIGQDKLDWVKIIAAMLVVLGVFIVTRSYKQESKKALADSSKQ